MTEVAERYGAIANGFTARVTQISPEQWSALTPCTEWTVRDLVAHVVRTQRQVVATLGEGDAAEVVVDGDLAEQWKGASGDVMDALADPEQATKTVGGMFGEQPFETLVGRLLSADTLVHTWDLSRATGQGEDLDPGAVSKALEFLTPIDEAIRRPGGFAPRIEPAPDADEQTRFLNFCGRAV